MSADQIFQSANHGQEEHWISVSDMMAGLMVIFIFIAIIYIQPIVEVASSWQDSRTKLYEALRKEFKDDLQRWNAELDREKLVVRFKSPDVLFSPAEAMLKPEFKSILDDFFPRYINILYQFKDKIEEVRIEGHTSSEWYNASADEAYFQNMALSQERTRSVLKYCLLLPSVSKYKDWARENITANGLSSSQLIKPNGIEDKERSRRVEFRVRTDAEKRIEEIMKKTKVANGL